MALYIGVDGGGTKTRIAVIDGELNRVAEYNFEASNLFSTDYQLALERIKDSIEMIRRSYKIEGVGIGLAGIDSSEIQRGLKARLKDFFPDLEVEVANDGLVSLLGALNQKPGILINSGTGSIAIGIDSQGRVLRAGGWDFLLGDEGSGFWIGQKLIKEALQDFDQGETSSPLVQTVAGYFGVNSLENIINIVYNKDNNSKELIAGLALKATEMALAGEARVQKIYSQVGQELAKLIIYVYRKGDFTDRVLLTYSGSIFKSFNLFQDSFFGYLTAQNLLFDWQEPEYPPEIGAALMVMNLKKELNKN